MKRVVGRAIADEQSHETAGQLFSSDNNERPRFFFSHSHIAFFCICI